MTNKTEIIKSMAATSVWTKTQIEEIVEHFLGTVQSALTQGNDVNLPGFGKFTVSERAERQGRNPATGEAVTIAASRSVKFKPAKGLKDAM